MNFKTPEEREKYIQDNMGLVNHVVTQLSVLPNNFEDALQEGTIGLILSIDRFDESRNIAFATFATRYIRGYVLDFINYNSCLRPHRKYELIQDEGKIRYKFKGWERPSITSLDKIIFEDENNKHNLLSFLGCAECEELLNIFERESKQEFKKGYKKFIDSLNSRDKIIFGLHLNNTSQQKIAERLGISQSYVSRLLRKIVASAKTFWRGYEESQRGG